MTQTFMIPARLPSLNEVIAQNRRNCYAGAKLKRDTEEMITRCINAGRLSKVENPCIVHMVFEEGNRKRDVDNVESAKKFVLDALVKANILQGDSPKYVIGTPSFTRYSDGSKVIVTIVDDQDTEKLRTVLRSASDKIIRGIE